MKLLCIILSVYIILLSVRPCCTDDICTENINKKTTQLHQDDVAGNDCTTCSPFYRCGTCSGFIILGGATYSFLLDTPQPKTHAIYRQPAVKEISIAIWQPPQLS